jgi:hypothetical protein
MRKIIKKPRVTPVAKTFISALGACLVLSLALSHAQAEIIPADRRIPWAAGVSGGIPSYPVAINVKDAAYGAVGNGSADDTTAIRNAIAACPPGSAVYLPRGTYKITDTLTISKSIALRGAGMDNTRIVLDTNSAKKVISIAGSMSQSTAAVTGGYNKGSTQLTFASPDAISAIVPGDMIAVYQKNDPALVDARGCTWGGLRNAAGDYVFQVQMARVTGKTNSTLTLARPLYWSLQSGLSPEVRRYGNAVQRAGIEELSVDTANYYAADSIALYGTIDCWVKNVEVLRSAKSFIWITLSLNAEVRGSYIADPHNTEGGSGYGYHLFGPNSDHLIEDNIAEHCRHSFVLEGAVSGSVFGYNYSKDPHSTVSLNWVYNDLITHALHPFMNLYEGNVIHKWSEDYVHGSASHNTGFRNHIKIVGDSKYPYTSGLWAVSQEPKNYYSNVVGNVLGWPGLKSMKSSAAYEGPYDSIFKLGYNGEGASAIEDTLVKDRLLRHGNFDYVTNSTQWDASISDRNLPASLYHTGKPAFFGSVAWPPIGPDRSPMVSKIPAELRYSGELDPNSGLAAPQNLRLAQ